MSKHQLIKLLRAMKDQRPLAEGFAVMIERGRFSLHAQALIEQILTKAYHSANTLSEEHAQINTLKTTIS